MKHLKQYIYRFTTRPNGKISGRVSAASVVLFVVGFILLLAAEKAGNILFSFFFALPGLVFTHQIIALPFTLATWIGDLIDEIEANKKEEY